jgi:hypothetical protein
LREQPNDIEGFNGAHHAQNDHRRMSRPQARPHDTAKGGPKTGAIDLGGLENLIADGGEAGDIENHLCAHPLENIGENVDLLKNQVTKAFGAEVESGGAGIKQTVKQGLEQAQAAADKIAGNTLGTNTQKLTDTLVNAPKLNFAPATTNTVATIRLTMPDTLNFSYGVQYDKLSVADAAGSVPLVGTIAKAITSAASSGLGKLAMNKLGYAFNPQEQQVFEGIDFREYEMTFVFTPISDKEARTIKEIIKTFRKHAAPTIVGAGGFFFNPPSVFDVSFFQNGQPNYNLNAIRRSVITNISVDYAPNGWSAFKNGAPVQTTMTISFRETELVDRTSIESER